MADKKQCSTLRVDMYFFEHSINGLVQEWYLKCVSNEDTTVLHWAIDMKFHQQPNMGELLL